MKRNLFVNVCLSIIMFFALNACQEETPENPGNPIGPPQPITPPFTVPDGFKAEVFAQGLDLPTSLEFAPDGSNRLFVNELQSGNIRIIQDGELLPDFFASVRTGVSGGFPVQGENGLIGITFDPDYVNNRFVYVTYVVRNAGVNTGRVARFRDDNNVGRDFTVLLDGIPSAPGHQIQSLRFGPDGKLYVSVSDAFAPDLDIVQDTSSLFGKMLRMNPDGSIPDDNPFADTYTYALGFRNFYDFVFLDNGDLIQVENGSFFNDEMNVVVAGGNYGFPDVIGGSASPNFTNPIHVWSSIVAPAGLEVYKGTQFPAEYQGRLFLTLFGDTFSNGSSFISKRIQSVSLEGSGLDTKPTFEDFVVYNGPGVGNPLDVTIGPDGSLYFSDIFTGRIYKVSVE